MDSLIIETLDQAEAAVAQITALTLQLNDETNQQNAKLVLARKHDDAIKSLEERRARYEDALETWANKNRKSLGLAGEPGEKKSIDLRQGTIGFRWGRPKVAFLKGFTEDVVLARLRRLARKAKHWARYIRVAETLNRSQILDDARPEAGLLSGKDLTHIGVEVTREETFYVEPKLEPVPE